MNKVRPVMAAGAAPAPGTMAAGSAPTATDRLQSRCAVPGMALSRAEAKRIPVKYAFASHAAAGAAAVAPTVPASAAAVHGAQPRCRGDVPRRKERRMTLKRHAPHPHLAPGKPRNERDRGLDVMADADQRRPRTGCGSRTSPTYRQPAGSTPGAAPGAPPAGSLTLSESTTRADRQLATQINGLIIEREAGVARLTPGSASPKE
jgi:hypothetical protein